MLLRVGFFVYMTQTHLENRYCCRACRMTKCYALGMSEHGKFRALPILIYLENSKKELSKRKSTTDVSAVMGK